MASKVDNMIEKAVYLAGPGNLGYTQGDDRWHVWANGHGDCATYNLVCARDAGIPIGGATYTGDMPYELPKVGWKEIPLKNRHRGCFVVRPKTSSRSGHTAMLIDDNDNVAEALSNEYGTAFGGKPGDQTGREVVVRKYNGFATRCFEPPADAYKEIPTVPVVVPKPEPKRPDKEPDFMISGNEMFRLYNPNTGDHLFTTNKTEKTSLVKAGWKDEGVAWKVDDDRTPVYRLYNSFNNGDHMYTASLDECNSLIKLGWDYEGIVDYAAKNKDDGVPVYRLYNDKGGNHMFTTNETEKKSLLNNGWKDEGVAWYTLTK